MRGEAASGTADKGRFVGRNWGCGAWRCGAYLLAQRCGQGCGVLVGVVEEMVGQEVADIAFDILDVSSPGVYLLHAIGICAGRQGSQHRGHGYHTSKPQHCTSRDSRSLSVRRNGRSQWVSGVLSIGKQKFFCDNFGNLVCKTDFCRSLPMDSWQGRKHRYRLCFHSQAVSHASYIPPCICLGRQPGLIPLKTVPPAARRQPPTGAFS